MNKNGDFLKQISPNYQRMISYFLVKCVLDDKRIDEKDKSLKKLEPYNFEIGQDDNFEPTVHISII